MAGRRCLRDSPSGGSGPALTARTDGVRAIRNPSPDSSDGDSAGSGLALTVETNGCRTVRNSSPDSPEGDLGGQGSL